MPHNSRNIQPNFLKLGSYFIFWWYKLALKEPYRKDFGKLLNLHFMYIVWYPIGKLKHCFAFSWKSCWNYEIFCECKQFCRYFEPCLFQKGKYGGSDNMVSKFTHDWYIEVKRMTSQSDITTHPLNWLQCTKCVIAILLSPFQF